jgi:hypothetical protein
MTISDMSTSNKPSLAIFANFFIDNEERYLRMCDSFYSFCDIKPKQWVVNVRGGYSEQVVQFFRAKITNNLSITCKDSKSDWLRDSRVMAKKINTDLVMFWIEDHICQVSPELLARVLNEFYHSAADQLLYSWWNTSNKKVFDVIGCEQGEYINLYNMNTGSIKKIEKFIGKYFYIVSAVSVMRKEFFIYILSSHKPYLKRYPRYTPFNFEKRSSDKIVNNILYAFPRIELFVSIDDDQGNEKYSLISRGEYPDRMLRNQMIKLEYPKGRIYVKIANYFPPDLKKILAPVYTFFLRLFYTFF